MNIISFFGLIHEIFKKGKPDINKIQDKGLLAVKIGQAFALRIDFLNPETTTELSKLYQDNQTLPSEELDILLKSYVQKDWYDHFASIEEEPMASASIGQVHRGELKDGTAVVVKVIKKNFTENFRRDANRVMDFFKVVTFFYPKLRRVANPVALIEMIREDTLSELNLDNEIKHQLELREIYQEYHTRLDLSDLDFPKIYPELSNEKVMVSEEIVGETVERLLEKESMDYKFLRRLFRLQGFFMFGIGRFHGDLHPGNLIVYNDKYYFVDCGALGSVSENLRVGLFNFMKHLSHNEFDQCAEALHQMSETQLSEEKFEKYRIKFNKLYENFPGKSVSEVSLTRQMMETIKLGVHHGMDFEKGIFPIIKSLMYLDGMVIRCNPDAIMMEDMRPDIPILEEWVNRKG